MKQTIVRNLALAALVLVLALGSFLVYEKNSSSESDLAIPRMLGMEGEEGETLHIAGKPSTNVKGPFFETQGAAVSMNKDLRTLPQTGPTRRTPMKEMGHGPEITGTQGLDPVIQTNKGIGNRPLGAPLAAAPGPLTSFKGLDLNNWGGGWPPDTHGDVGPNHYIQVVNTSIGIFNKSTGARLAAFTFNSFFSANGASGVCATSNNGDPEALYDQTSGRWIITDFAWSNIMNGPYYECIAVSKTSDPISGGWWLYTFTADSANLNDYPKLGLWNDGIYMSSNLFDCLDSQCGSANYSGVKVWALNRDDLISGAPLRSISYTLGTSYFSLLPANLKGAAAPAGTPEYFLSDGTSSSVRMWKFAANWNTPSSSTITGPTSITIASFTQPTGSVPQQGSSEKVDTLGDRLMTWLQYRNIGGNESLWVSRTVMVGTSTGVRWMEIRNMKTTPTVYQQGTYAPDSNYRWMPSLAVNQSGDMAIGYSVSSSTMYPAIRYAGRLASDPLGTLGQTETTLIAGTGSQSGGYNRWGDYSSMSIDPVDDCTFWYTTEYYETTGNNWQTRIGSFKFASCGGSLPPTATPTVTFTATPTYTPTLGPTPTMTFTPTPGPTATNTPPGDTNVIVNPGFESGPGVGWQEHSKANYELIDGTLPHTGSFSAYLCNYNSCNEYVQQTILVPSNGTLTYWWYMTSSDAKSRVRDYLRVQVYSTAGKLLKTLRIWNNTKVRDTWSQDTLSLSTYAGKTVILRFASTNNASNPTGFWIDDVSVK